MIVPRGVYFKVGVILLSFVIIIVDKFFMFFLLSLSKVRNEILKYGQMKDLEKDIYFKKNWEKLLNFLLQQELIGDVCKVLKMHINC